MVGTVDTWLIWNLTDRMKYVTDVTNASRTMLMNIKTLDWDEELCSFFGIDSSILASICSSAEQLGHMSYENCPFQSLPIAGCLGDQQAALVGQRCFKVQCAESIYLLCVIISDNIIEILISNVTFLLSLSVTFRIWLSGRDGKEHLRNWLLYVVQCRRKSGVFQ